MYKQVETDKQIRLVNNEKVDPVATLADEYGGRVQICLDDHCYVLYLKVTNPLYNDRYMVTLHIFKEAFEVLKTLPSPDKGDSVHTKSRETEREQESTIEWYQERAKELGDIIKTVFRRWHKDRGESCDEYFPDKVDRKYKELLGLLKVAICPDCNGSGSIPHVIAEYEFHPPSIGFQQCQWCDMRNRILDSIRD